MPKKKKFRKMEEIMLDFDFISEYMKEYYIPFLEKKYTNDQKTEPYSFEEWMIKNKKRDNKTKAKILKVKNPN